MSNPEPRAGRAGPDPPKSRAQAHLSRRPRSCFLIRVVEVLWHDGPGHLV